MTQPDRPTEESLEDLVERYFAEGGVFAPSIEEFARQHPDHSEELLDLLPTVQLLKDAAGALEEGDGQRKLQALETWISRMGRPDDYSTSTAARLIDRLSDREHFTDRYVVKDEVGRGGQGTVLVVWDEDLHRDLAMKVLADERLEGPARDRAAGSGTLERFLEEARVTAQLDHPGIVPVHELGVASGGRVYFTMKLVKGRDLQTVFGLARGGEEGWSTTRALNVLLKVCEAMAYAHSKGVLHRDLKPSNVMVGRYGEVYVMDWGLAKVRGREDRKDLRIRPEGSAHAGDDPEAGADADAPLLTMDGDVVGTPSYMSPEQAAGDLEAMGPHSDVYSIGCMLYHLLTGRMPYADPGRRPDNHAILREVQARPPTPIAELAPGVPVELRAVADKAMAREPRERFRDVSELADDLRAYLENRVVRSYEHGAVAELRKWVGRNKPFAGALAAAVLGLAAGLAVSLALRAKAVAQSESVFRLSALQTLDDVIEEADELWPAHPDNIDAYVDWLDRARALVRSRSLHLRERDRLRATAIPRTPREVRQDRERHPEFALLERRKEDLAFRRIALRQRREGRSIELPTVDWSTLPEDARGLDGIARRLTHWRPGAHYGEEARGFVIARHALELAEDAGDVRLVVAAAHTLSHAAFVLGRDDEALAASRRALDVAPAELRAACAERLSSTRARVDHARSEEGLREAQAELARLEGELADLDRRLSERREWRFRSDEDRWWHDQLEELVNGLGALEGGLLAEDAASEEHGWSVPRRLAFARRLQAAYAPGGEYDLRWKTALPGIRACYPDLDLSIQMGLVPIGQDRQSGLWEFWHVASGTEPTSDERGRPIPSADAGLVFVLLPGGRFWRGAQGTYPDRPNYDPAAEDIEEPVREIELSPFFLSKYEMTQGQWWRLTGRDPAYYGAEHRRIDSRVHPVESIDWFDCMSVLPRAGLELPTETRWEYGARAGTGTPWWPGADAETVARSGGITSGLVEYEYPIHSPVGASAPNAFGLHEVIGNVSEWCRDVHASWHYWRWSDKDPFQPDATPAVVEEKGQVTVRGGHFLAGLGIARVTCRQRTNARTTAPTIGVRPARSISD